MFSNGLPCNLPFPSCLGVPKDSGSDELLPTSMGNREPVILNVYDMVSIVIKYQIDFGIYIKLNTKCVFFFNTNEKKYMCLPYAVFQLDCKKFN